MENITVITSVADNLCGTRFELDVPYIFCGELSPCHILASFLHVIQPNDDFIDAENKSLHLAEHALPKLTILRQR